MAWAQHGKCESDTAALCKSNGKDTFYEGHLESKERFAIKKYFVTEHVNFGSLLALDFTLLRPIHTQHASLMPFPCLAHAVPMPSRAAKDLECVFPTWFTQCGRVWFTLAIPRPCHPRPFRFSQGHGTARPSRYGLWATCLRSTSSGYHAEFHEVLIRPIPISDAGGQCETKHRLHGQGKEW